jgi:hypothetical protein
MVDHPLGRDVIHRTRVARAAATVCLGRIIRFGGGRRVRQSLVREHRGAGRRRWVARIGRDEQAGLADLGLRLAEAKQLTSAIQAEIVPTLTSVLVVRCLSYSRRCAL